MELDRTALNAACFSLAKSSKWERRPVDVVSVETLAERLSDIACDHAEYIRGKNRDPNIVTRAVRYIEHHHGYPWGDRTDWFTNVLETLVELACPNAQPSIGSELFYQDIEGGIAQARAGYEP